MAALVLAVLLCLVAPMSVGSTAARSLLQPGGNGPGGGGGAPSTPGATSSSVCGSATTCSSTGVAYASRSLAYANGVFTGSITTNQCPTLVTTFAQASASCEMQAFPASAATYTAIGAAGVAAPLLGRVGLTLGGINIYGPFEAGFSNGNGPTVCGTSSYYCTPGMDVSSCVQELYATCGTSQKGAVDSTLAGTSFGDTCGGHASPYHYHVDLGCEYASNSLAAPPSAHSPLVGIALDGRGIYGAWEGGAAPVLDSCNGHVGPVPGTMSANAGVNTTSYTTVFADMPAVPTTAVYHYHLSSTFPYTVGCFASQATSYDACAALYPGQCGTFAPASYANGSAYFYDNYCQCGNQNGQGSRPVSAIGAAPLLAGAACYSTASATAPCQQPTACASASTGACSAALLSSWLAANPTITSNASGSSPPPPLSASSSAHRGARWVAAAAATAAAVSILL